MNRKLPPNLYERKYKTRAGYKRTLYHAQFTDWTHKRRFFPLGDDYTQALDRYDEIMRQNRRKYDFDNGKKVQPGNDAVSLAGPPQVQFSGEDIRAMRHAVVYALVQGEKVLYVGQSSTGVNRIFDPRHHRLAWIDPNHRLLIWAVPSAVDAVNLERLLIAKLRPAYNSAGLVGARSQVADPPRLAP